MTAMGILAAMASLLAAPGCGESSNPAPAASAAIDLPLDAAAIAELDRGVGQLGMFDFTAAEATFAGVLQARPRLYEARIDHAIAVMNQPGKDSQRRAIELLDGILRDRPGDMRAEYCQALCYLMLGDPVHAMPRLRRVVERDGTDPYAQAYAGECSERQGEMDAARAFYARSAELDPFLRSAFVGLQRVAERRGDAAAASRAVDALQRLAGNPRGHVAEFSYTRMGPLAEAVLPAVEKRTPVRPTGPILAPLAAMPIDGMPPAPAVVHAITPAADLDGDGTLDFVAQVEYPEEMRIERRVVRSLPGGRWRMEPGSIDTFRRGRQFWGDFDNDGRVDVAFGRVDSATRIIGGGVWVGWAHQEPDGRWQPFTFQGATQPADDLQLCADLDHDGDLDFVYTGPLGSGVLWNMGRPSAREPVEWDRRPIAGSLSEARAAAADLDGNGDLDLLLWSATGAAAQAWQNDGPGAWRRDASLAAFESSGPGAVVPFRHNEDGSPAIATLVDGEPGSQRAMQLWERDGAAWKAGRRTPCAAAAALWVTDLSGSGHANIVVRDVGSLVVMDAFGGVVERIPGVPTNAELAVVDARGPVLVAAAEADGVRWMGPGSGRSPYAAIAFRGRTDPSQEMRTNASGIGTRLDARIGGEWVACDALPWRGGGTQALEPVLVGLGDASRIDFVAIRWPDAVMQSELGIAAGSSTITEMRRSGAEQPRSEEPRSEQPRSEQR
jgi:Tfp pilus assembly protein PilF